MSTVEQLSRLHLGFTVLPSPETVLDWFRILQCGWVHNGNPKNPHVILHSGRHSTGFFNCKILLSHGNLRELIAAALVTKIRSANFGPIHGVFGAPYSSITLAADVARLLLVPNYIVEKDPAGGMVYKPDNPIPAGAVLLDVEELVTTLDSAITSARAIIKGNPNPVSFYPKVATLIYRPESLNTPVRERVMPLVEREVPSWLPQDCPLCQQGSEPLLPKGENWARLLAI